MKSQLATFMLGVLAFTLLLPASSSAAVVNLNGLNINTQFLVASSSMHMNITSLVNTHTFQWNNTPWRVDQGGTGATTFSDGSVLFYSGGFSQNNSKFFWDNTNSAFRIGTNTAATPSKLTIVGSVSQALLDVISTIGSHLFYVAESGNVGIGTISPLHALDVTGSFYSRLVTLTDTSSLTVNWNTGNVQSLTLTTNTALAFSNSQAGGEYKMILKQDATGGRTVTWPGSVKWAGGVAPTITPGSSSTDVISFLYDGISYLGSYALNFGTSTPSASVAVLVVGGGGGGGPANYGGGGGAGGYQADPSLIVTPQAYPVTRGAGGSSSSAGSDSTFSSITAIGGGYGGFYPDNLQGGDGGSGGGGTCSTASYNGGTGSQGQNGGNSGNCSGLSAGGGGGGVISAGANGFGGNNGGDGGNGTANSISGAPVTYAGGGGGGYEATSGAGGSGGTGGGGRGFGSGGACVNGTANLGGGGGGGGCSGGSGVVIISYPTGSITATGGTITTSGGNTIHTFTSNGTFTVTSI